MTVLALACDLQKTDSHSDIGTELLFPDMKSSDEGGEVDAVVSAAVLATLAFRLKDERSLVAAMRRLATAVDALERAHAAA